MRVARDGTPETLVLMLEDATEQFDAADRFERTFAANPAPTLILRLHDSRYIKVNEEFLRMTGDTREEIIERPMRELDALHAAEHRVAAIRALHDGATIAQQESLVPLPDGGSKFVIVAGPPIEVGDGCCMLFTFIDLDVRKRAEAARVLMTHAAFTAITGYTESGLTGHAVYKTNLLADAASLREQRAGLAVNTTLHARELRVRTRAGAIVDCRLSVEPVTIQDDACVLCVLEDVTGRKRSEADLVTAIEAVMKDTSWLSRTVMDKLAQLRHPRSANADLDALTPREREILERMCKWHTDAEIATALKLSRNTVRNHVASLYGKLGVRRRAAAVAWGRERGLAAF